MGLSVQAPCCGKVYTCRFCHNEEEEHELDRKKVSEVVCMMCERRQVVGGSCSGCGVVFGKVCLPERPGTEGEIVSI